MGASARCPDVIRNAAGLPQPSTTAWILSVCRLLIDRSLQNPPSFSASGTAVGLRGGAIEPMNVPVGRFAPEPK